MGNCVYKQYYKDPKSKEPKKDVRNVNWFIDYFGEAYQLIKTNLNVFLFSFYFNPKIYSENNVTVMQALH